MDQVALRLSHARATGRIWQPARVSSNESVTLQIKMLVVNQVGAHVR